MMWRRLVLLLMVGEHAVAERGPKANTNVDVGAAGTFVAESRHSLHKESIKHKAANHQKPASILQQRSDVANQDIAVEHKDEVKPKAEPSDFAAIDADKADEKENMVGQDIALKDKQQPKEFEATAKEEVVEEEDTVGQGWKECRGGSMTEKEAENMLALHNEMRCALGAPALEWNGDLQCQAQETQNELGAFDDGSKRSYKMTIPAGENIYSTGSSVRMAAWGWFTEYVAKEKTERGHFAAMVWKGTTQLGCGIQRKEKEGKPAGIRCQYAKSPPNVGNPEQYKTNVPSLKRFEPCGIIQYEHRQHGKQSFKLDFIKYVTMLEEWHRLNPSKARLEALE